MQKKTYEVQAMYGDHHVTEVRSILLGLDGVMDVYASSAFQAVEVVFDESQTTEAEITAVLDQAGYLGEWTFPVEIGAIPADTSNGQHKPFFRHTEVFANTRQVVSFTQSVVSTGRPLWPCPGFDRPAKLDE